MGSGINNPGWDGPSEDPVLREAQLALGEGAAGLDPNMPTGALQSPLANADYQPPLPQGMQQGQDSVLDQMLGQIQAVPSLPQRPKRQKRYRKPNLGDIVATARRDQDRHRLRIERQARDVALYRQHTGGKPQSFDPSSDQEVRSAQLSTLVNKLAALFSGLDQKISLPYDHMEEEKAAQRVENALYQTRKLAKRQHARDNAGEDLQRTEFFYLLLHGSVYKRILPDTDDARFPWQDVVMDPATCYPTYGDGKRGLVRFTRIYTSTIGEIVTLYGQNDPDLEKRLFRKLGHDGAYATGDFWNIDGEVIEYWDDQWHAVTFRGEEVIPPMEHGLPRIPIITATAVGEPKSMATPGGHYLVYSDLYKSYIPQTMGVDADMAEKGVSVFHYLINTHRLKEMLQTLLFSEVEKAGDPPLIEYTAPHLMNKEYPSLATKRGKSNKRQLGMHEIQPVPTSPRPTDFSPLYSSLQEEFMQGSLSPAAFGAEMGSNITGTGLDTLIQNTKDMALPYIKAWETMQAAEHETRLEQYVDIISDTLTISAPALDVYGNHTGELHDMSARDVQLTGMFVEVEASGMSDQNRAAQIAAMNQGVQAGFFSQRYAMNELDVKDPDAMFAEILAEKAMQHPEIMENYLIPQGFLSQGMDDLAQMWMEMVVAPKLAMMSAGMAPGGGGGEGGMMGEAGGGGSQAVPVPPGMPPDQGPGGPPPGMGRGPSEGPPAMSI